jgi:hypothetical protein
VGVIWEHGDVQNAETPPGVITNRLLEPVSKAAGTVGFLLMTAQKSLRGAAVNAAIVSHRATGQWTDRVHGAAIVPGENNTNFR